MALPSRRVSTRNSNWHYNHYETRALEDAFDPSSLGWTISRLGRIVKGSSGSTSTAVSAIIGMRIRSRRVRRRRSHRGRLREYDQDSRKRVILLSNDHGFVGLAREEGVLAQHVSFPVDIPRKVTVSWDELQDSPYTLSVVFGVLRLPKVTLYGVWNDKAGEDWQRRCLDVDCRSEKVHEKLRRSGYHDRVRDHAVT